MIIPAREGYKMKNPPLVMAVAAALIDEIDVIVLELLERGPAVTPAFAEMCMKLDESCPVEKTNG